MYIHGSSNYSSDKHCGMLGLLLGLQIACFLENWLRLPQLCPFSQNLFLSFSFFPWPYFCLMIKYAADCSNCCIESSPAFLSLLRPLFAVSQGQSCQKSQALFYRASPSLRPLLSFSDSPSLSLILLRCCFSPYFLRLHLSSAALLLKKGFTDRLKKNLIYFAAGVNRLIFQSVKGGNVL